MLDRGGSTVDLPRAGIGDAGAAAALKEASHLASLTALDLGGNGIGAAGERALGEALQWRRN
jgi:hypothetical protein